jgi:hypothetical protein
MEEQGRNPSFPSQPEVSFPQPREPEARSSNAKIIIAVVGIIAIILLGGWFILGNSSGSESPSPTPSDGLTDFPSPATTATPTPSATSSPSPADKSKIKVEVLNGTGVPGEASFLQKELEELGFENIEAGNADEQDQTETIATYSRELSATVADEITARLEELYEKVRTRRATVSGGFDLTITTGPRKKTLGATSSPTAKASASPTTKASASPTATAKATATPTPSPTATPS